jgi:hypothetical protein
VSGALLIFPALESAAKCRRAGPFGRGSKAKAPTPESEVLEEMGGEQGQTEARTALSKSCLVHMTRLCRVTLPLMT